MAEISTGGAAEAEASNVFVNEEQLAHNILHGEMANLAGLRQVESQSEFLSQRGGDPFLGTPVACRITLNQQGEEEEDSVIAGEVFVSASQVLFVASSDPSKDLAIGATCITLHAMMEEPEVALYLQLSVDDDDDGAGGDEDVLSDVTIVPLDAEACQSVFNALCKLVSSHPLDDDDDDEDQGEFQGVGDDLVWAPAAGYFEGGDDEEGTNQERDDMLERLDNLLVVRPEFEITDGQFDDAEEN